MKRIRKEDRNHETWLAQYPKGSRRQYERAWRYWEKYIEPKTEAWILDNLQSEDWGAHLVNFRRSLSQKPKHRGKGTLSDNTTKLYANSIRAYLRYVGAALSLNKTQKFTLTKIENMPETDYPFNLKVKEVLMRVADPIEDYVLCAGVSFGLRASDFIKITRGQLEPLIHLEPPIQLGEIVTIKEGIKAYPFIDRDAKESIERLLRIMDREGRTDPDEPMLQFRTSYKTRELNGILKGLFEKAGVSLGEFRVRFHILRKFITDQLASVCAEDKWKHFVGKKTRSPYVSQEGREAYTKVMEFTNINHKEAKGQVWEYEESMERLQRQIEDLHGQLGAQSNFLELMFEFLKEHHSEEDIAELKKKLLQVTPDADVFE